MTSRRLAVVFVCVILLGVSWYARIASADDGIPDNCENSESPFYLDGVFARFEPQHHRLVLVNWNTGEFVQTLDDAAGEGYVLQWSLDCRYLVVALTIPTGYDTVVYDTVANFRIGSVPDAHGQPHHITWGPDNYLIVETRNGAILWHVPTNTQHLLTTSYNVQLVRNFREMTWDMEQMRLHVRLADEARWSAGHTYDLLTGQDITPAPTPRSVYVSGTTITCEQPVGIEYLFNIGEIRGGGWVLEREITTWVRSNRGSLNCRYTAASIGNGDGTSDTYVWDLITGLRVGVFPDARIIPHPITWGADSLVITTRDGAYLWVLPTDTRILIQASVVAATTGEAALHAFWSSQFSRDGRIFYGVRVDAVDRVTAYDGGTGAVLAEYPVSGAVGTVEFALSQNGHTLAVYDPNTLHVRITDLTSGTANEYVVSGAADEESAVRVSPDGRFVVMVSFPNQLTVWDVNALGAAPNAVYTLPDRYALYNEWRGNWYLSFSTNFPDNVTFAYTLQNAPQFQIDLVAGVLSGDNDPSVPLIPVNGEQGSSSGYGCLSSDNRYALVSDQLVLRAADSETVIHVFAAVPDLIRRSGAGVSQNCRYMGIVEVVDAGTPYDYERVSTLRIIDLETSAELITVPHASRLYWSPDSHWAYIPLPYGHDHYLWNVTENRLLPIESPGFIYPFRVYWDFPHGLVFLGLTAYDLNSGERRGDFDCTHPYGYWGCDEDWRLSTEGHNVLIDNGTGFLAIYDLRTYEAHHFYIGLQIVWRIAISPDMSMIAGGNELIRVWREWLPGMSVNDYEGTPDYEFAGPGATVSEIRFIDNYTLETVSADGVQRWDIESGTLLP